ncbi:MAG: endopeptidase La [Bdellovibrionales bacterium]|nr:endopeptidase La [Bdellovibrionales bacterium]
MSSSSRKRKSTTRRKPKGEMLELPFVPVSEASIFPGSVFSVHVSRVEFTPSVDEAIAGGGRIILGFEYEPDKKGNLDVDSIGVMAHITHCVRTAAGERHLRVHVLNRVEVREVVSASPSVWVRAESRDDPTEFELTEEDEKLMAEFKENLTLFSSYDSSAEEHVALSEEVYHPGVLADLAASAMSLKEEEALGVLRELDPRARLNMVYHLMQNFLDRESLRERIAKRVDKALEREEYEQLLREQLQQIRTELGEANDWENDISDLKESLRKLKMPKAIRQEAETQIRRLQQLHPDTSEAALARTYLDWIVDLPWSKRTRDKLDLAQARAILDEDHFGLEKTKERILDFLSVRKLNKSLRGPVLLLVGPPGVGKTSLGKSIARALGRKFVRASVGGLRDEAELRGHRKTYVGAMPGRIIQGLKNAKSKNALMMLDEIDKIGSDFRGDPASVMLEILDPEQNNSFQDHYLNLPFDLSEVMFIATANVTDTIPPALLDRMEVIELSGYALEEKLEIAKRYLLPRAREENGLKEYKIEVSEDAVREMIAGYTRESGVRELGRVVSKLFRKVARLVAEGEEAPTKIGKQNVAKLLGPSVYVEDEKISGNVIGVATGLAWTADGGETLVVEAAVTPGKGNLALTGQLGEVMRESAHAALTYILANAAELGVEPDFLSNSNVHIHVPHGAIPKDGPSAGVTIATALLSLLTDRPVSSNVAMTGEITLRGRVMEIGGLKEKALAAKRADIPVVVIPHANKREIEKFPKFLTDAVTFVAVRDLREVFEVALLERTKLKRSKRKTRTVRI